MALDAVVHMVERIQIAHLDLDGYGEFEVYGFHIFNVLIINVPMCQLS
jgi:hypothetical protein